MSSTYAYRLAAVVVSLAAAGVLPAQQRPASPRDSAVASFGDAKLSVDYGRPYKRGREIFGGLVPWNRVWRTGANAATTFVTSRDLEIGGQAVPAGSYTLYTVPAPTGWKLIINKQTGQWGTAYDESQDLARIDMKVDRVATPVEQFTIELAPSGSAGVMNLVWDTTRASVPITVKK
jgi:DUF2911 family protein